MNRSHDFPFNILDVAELIHLKMRRPHATGGYYDCPFCGDKRGKMSINIEKNAWRCNYCGEHGGMLALYARINRISTSTAYREICESLQNGEFFEGYNDTATPARCEQEFAEQSKLADVQTVHKTLSTMLGLLTLSKAHRRHLTEVRGLTDEQIHKLEYRSTPPFYACKRIARVLREKGCTLDGVPGFYVKDGEWTVKFYSKTAGILIPVRGIDGLIRGMQIRLDIPIKDEGAAHDKSGTKYIWLSSTGKEKGVGSGSPVHFIGDRFARAVYITEGFLKADIAHYLMNRSFIAIAGINNTGQLELMFNMLKKNGTEIIIEAADMDKFRNENVNRGVSNIYLIAKKCGLKFRRLTWNPNFKGIDDWQLSLRKKELENKGERKMNFKQRFIYGLCSFDALEEEITEWQTATEHEGTLEEHLGFTAEEFSAYGQADDETFQRDMLLQRKVQPFRIYQLDFSDGNTKPYAFDSIDTLHKAGFEQPPARDYACVYEGEQFCFTNDTTKNCLELIFKRFNERLPEEYKGRNIAPSDIIELYSENTRRYYYTNKDGFSEVKFSPLLAKRKIK